MLFAPYSEPSHLFALPWKDARPLAKEVCQALREGERALRPGLWNVLWLLCRGPLLALASRYREVKAEEMLGLYGEGVSVGVAPWGHAKRTLAATYSPEETEEILDEEPAPESDPLAAARLVEAFSQLSPDDQVYLKDYQTKTTRELAEAWGVPLGTAKVRISRALARLRALLS